MNMNENMMDELPFNVEIIYALPHLQKRIQVKVNPGTTFIEAVRQSNLTHFFPELDLENIKIGVFSKLVKHDERVQQGQRIEVYRPLIADPKDVRRRRAEKAKEEGRANKVTGGKV